METRVAKDLLHALVPLQGRVRDDEALFDIIGAAGIVLLGESTHGTHEFYRARSEITKRLIAERGFTAVYTDAGRFPAWVRCNAEALEWSAWLRDYNDRALATGRSKVRFCELAAYVPIDAVDEKTVVWTNVQDIAGGRFGDGAVSIGFTTYAGTVTAASQWDGPQEQKRIVPARGDSYEYLFHSTNVPRFLVPLRAHRPRLAGLPLQARARAIGVVYRPESEPDNQYFTVRLIEQFDALYHFDVTRALGSEPSVGAPARSPSF